MVWPRDPPSGGISVHRLAFGGVIVAYLILAATYNLTVPIFEAPDEIWHYLYVRHLAEGGGLPRNEGRARGILSQQEAAQPPVYYAVAAALTFWAPRGDLRAIVRPNRAGHLGDAEGEGNRNMFLHGPDQGFPWRNETLTVHLVRLTTTVWGTLAVTCTYLIGRRVYSSPWLAVAAAAGVAFTPEFLFMSAAVNNDVAVAGGMAVLSWLGIRAAVNKPSLSQSIALGLVAGGAILVKPIAAGGLVVALLAVALGARRAHLRPGRLVSHLVLTLAGTVIACGWWFLYNHLTYGSVAPLQSFLSRDDLFGQLPTLRELVHGLPGLIMSYWAVFGWFSIVVPRQYYWYFAALMALAALGFVVLAIRRLRSGGDGSAGVAWSEAVLVGLGSLSIVVAVFAYRLIVMAFHGRLLLGGITGFAALLVLGWSALPPRRLGAPLALALAATLAVPSALYPWTVLRPSYAAPPTFARSDIHPSRRLDQRFDAEMALLGVDVEPPDGARIQSGDEVSVTLYFEPLHAISKDYLIFVKLIDPDRHVLAGFDMHPGQGALPTSMWEPGTVVVDRYRLRVPKNAVGPTVNQIIVGLYPEDTLESLPVFLADGLPGSNSAVVSTLVIPGQVDLQRSQSGIAFQEGDRPAITFVESHPSRFEAAVGGAIDGTLVFGCITPLVRDYTVFLHLDGSIGTIGQDDSRPRRGAFPTVYWRPGDLIQHDWHIQLPPNVPPGEYQLIAGWYDLQTGQRLRTSLGDSVDVGRVVIR